MTYLKHTTDVYYDLKHYEQISINMSFMTSVQQLLDNSCKHILRCTESIGPSTVYSYYNTNTSVSITIRSFQHKGPTPTTRPAIVVNSPTQVDSNIKMFGPTWHHVGVTQGSILHLIHIFTLFTCTECRFYQICL